MNPEEAPKTPPEETPPQSVESPPAHSPAPPDKPKSKSRPVKVYLTVLFCVALLLLLISFVILLCMNLVSGRRSKIQRRWSGGRGNGEHS